MEKILKTRQLLIKSKLLKEKNSDLFNSLIENENETLLNIAKISSVLYHFEIDWLVNDKTFNIVKNEFDAYILEDNNIEIDKVPTDLYQDSLNLDADAKVEINYYTNLNNCYIKELKPKTK